MCLNEFNAVYGSEYCFHPVTDCVQGGVGGDIMIYSTYYCHYATCYDLMEFEGNQYCKIYSIVIRYCYQS